MVTILRSGEHRSNPFLSYAFVRATGDTRLDWLRLSGEFGALLGPAKIIDGFSRLKSQIKVFFADRE